MSESPLQDELQKKAASTIFELVWGWIQGLKDAAWDHSAVSDALTRYAATYFERHGRVKVLGMVEPVSLNQIYTRVRVVKENFLARVTVPAEMQKDFIEGGRKHAHFRDDQTVDGMTVANSCPCLSVLGAPGSGKSTFLRRIGLEAMLAPRPTWLKTVISFGLNNDDGRIPVLIELQTLRKSPVDLIQAIAHEFAVCGFPNNHRFVHEALKRGKLLILLDGLDEVPEELQQEVIRHVSNFVVTHGNGKSRSNRFVASCRTANYKNAFTQFKDVVLSDFNDEQIRQFSMSWFSGPHHKQTNAAEHFFKTISASDNTSAMELARTPLLLTLLCLTYDHGQSLPPTRATLYRRALDLLLREWAAERRVHGTPIHKDLHADLEIDMLAELAAKLFRKEQFFFDRDCVVYHIHNFMSSQLNAPRSLDASRILEAIEVQQGLIVRRATNVYSFSHLTIQEYLTAKRIWEEGEAAWSQLLRTHLHNERWLVVFELMAGLGDCGRFLNAMAVQVEAELTDLYKSVEELRKVSTWIREMARDTVDWREAAGLRLTLLAIVYAVTGKTTAQGQCPIPAALAAVAKEFSEKAALRIESLQKTFQVSSPPERPPTRLRPMRAELLIDGDTTEYDRAVQEYHKRLPFEISHKDAQRENTIRGILAEVIAQRTGGGTNVENAIGAASTRLLEEITATANNLKGGGAFPYFDKALTGWTIVTRCKRAAYHLLAIDWATVCEKVLSAGHLSARAAIDSLDVSLD